MQYMQSAHPDTHRYLKRIIIISALMMTVILIGCSNRVAAQCTACPLPSFEPPKSYPFTSMANSSNRLVVGDFNNDGKPDLVATGGLNGGGTHVKVYLNDGSGGFAPPIDIGLDADAIAAADFNNDGNLDLVMSQDWVLTIVHGDGTGHFGPGYVTDPSWGGATINLAVGDFNHDGKPDVLFVGRFATFLFLGDGFTLSSGPMLLQSGGDCFCDYLALAVGDFNGDGNLDFLEATSDIGLQLGDGTGNFQGINPNNPSWQDPIYESPIAMGDFNGDGRLDVAVPGVTVALNNGTGFSGGVFYGISDQGYQGWDIKTADINGDGKLDLVTVGTGKVFILLGNGDGTFGSPISFPGPRSDIPQRLAVTDFNGDGKPDIVVEGLDQNGSAQLMVFLNSTFQTAVGQNSTVSVNNTTLTFDDVTTGGTTSVTRIDPASVGQVPGGFSVSDSVAYEIATTATFTSSVTLAFKVPGPISQADFNNLAILHNVNGTLVDVTASTPARDYSALTIYATTSSFSPFYLARKGTHINSLFDETKAYKRGSNIPIKLQVLNAGNTNVSSSNTSLVTRDLRLISGNTLAPIEDSGDANPDYTFRYDSTLGGTAGGYIFNLSTKGLASGQYVLSFYVGSDRSFFYTVKFEVK